jgi:hypothetical protein
VSQPVDNASPWPTMQRYDYMVRLRKATDAELAQLQDSPAPTYPQRNAVLAALRQLSGRDLGTETEPWQKYAAQLAPKKPATDKTETPKDNPDLNPVEKDKPAERKPADKAADLAPKPMTTATSPDGKLIATADDKVVNIVDAQTMKQVGKITGSTARITAVAFSPDGSLIASGGADKAVRICEAATGKQMCVCRSTVGISAIAFSANGTTLTAVGIDQSTVSWDVDTGKQIAR